jgi:hypothetical protein
MEQQELAERFEAARRHPAYRIAMAAEAETPSVALMVVVLGLMVVGAMFPIVALAVMKHRSAATTCLMVATSALVFAMIVPVARHLAVACDAVIRRELVAVLATRAMETEGLHEVTLGHPARPPMHKTLCGPQTCKAGDLAVAVYREGMLVGLLEVPAGWGPRTKRQ